MALMRFWTRLAQGRLLPKTTTSVSYRRVLNSTPYVHQHDNALLFVRFLSTMRGDKINNSINVKYLVLVIVLY